MEKYFLFLDDLRRSGKINMYGAVPYLMRMFDMGRDESKKVLEAWMKDGARHRGNA